MIEMPKSSAKTFSLDENELIPAGTYEVVLEDATVRMYGENKDKPGLSCRFRIRNDIEQGSQGKSIFDTAWLDKDKENWDGWFDHRKLQKMLLTKDNPKLSFLDCDEMVQYLIGSCMTIEITADFDDRRGKNVNEVKYLSYRKSLVAPIGSVANGTTTTDPNTNDLPF